MRVRVGCEFQFESQHPVTTVMLVGTRSDGAHRTIYESRWLEPVLPVRDFRDAFANSCWRIEFPKGRATIRYDAVVDVDAEGVPIGIDIHQDASKVADLSKLEAEGPIFGLMPRRALTDR